MIESRHLEKKQGGLRLGIAGALAAFALIVGMTLNNTQGAAKPVGFVAIACVLGIGNLGLLAYLSLRSKLPALLKPVLVAALLFAGIYLIGVVQGRSLRALTTFGQVALVLGFFMAVSLCSWGRRTLQVFAWLSAGYILLQAAWWMAVGMPSGFSSYMANPNTLGPLLYLLLFFILAVRQTSRKHRWWWGTCVFIGLVLMVGVAARSAWLAALASFITYVSWNHITRNRLIFRTWLAAAFASIAVFTYFYALLPYHPKATYWNLLVRKYTGGGLLSGREDFWWPLIEVIQEHLFLGYGAGALPSDFWTTNLSAHSLYLQTALQVGIVGLVLFLCLMWAIWSIYWQGRRHPLVRLSAAFMIGILVHATFAVTLTQTSLTIGLLEWLVMGIGVSASIAVVRISPSKD